MNDGTRIIKLQAEVERLNNTISSLERCCEILTQRSRGCNALLSMLHAHRHSMSLLTRILGGIDAQWIH